MSREIKFTTDGKKVVVIGSLNSQEKIVQEIFIVDGSEIPSGEHFVVKSLHDAPAVSWKENDLKKLEERYEKKRKQYNDEIDKNYKAYKAKTSELRAKMAYIGAALKNANEKSFETLVDFITGETEWIVVNHYDVQLLPINEFHQMYEDKLRLISLFGKDDGSFTYAVGDYYDYSGGNKKFYPFKSHEEALSKFKEILLNETISEKNLLIAEKYGFEYPAEKVKEYKEKQMAAFSKNISDYKEKIKTWELSIDTLSK